MRALAMTTWLLLLGTAHAQSTCDTNCNQQASECLKKCTGDSKEAARPESAQRLLNCLKECDIKVKPCRDACAPPPATPVKKE